MQQMSEAMKSAKTIQSEMVQWENRLEAAKQEVGNFKRQSETLEQEIVAKRTEFASYISDRETAVRRGMESLAADRQALDAQREEFRVALDQHLKDKAALVQDRVNFEKTKSAVNGKHALINDFIQAVRRAYNVLPD